MIIIGASGPAGTAGFLLRRDFTPTDDGDSGEVDSFNQMIREPRDQRTLERVYLKMESLLAARVKGRSVAFRLELLSRDAAWENSPGWSG